MFTFEDTKSKTVVFFDSYHNIILGWVEVYKLYVLIIHIDNLYSKTYFSDHLY
jgi:hypothetical protein